MFTRFLIVIVLLSGCLRDEAPCAEDSDCYSGETCLDGVCQVPKPGPGAGPIRAGDGANHNGTALNVDDPTRPEMISYFDDGTWWYTKWMGETWQSRVVVKDLIPSTLNQTDLVRDTAGKLHFSAIDEAGNFVVVHQTESEWDVDVVARSDLKPHGNSLSIYRTGGLSACYVTGDIVKVLKGEEVGRAFFATWKNGEWESIELPSTKDELSPTFGCALALDPATGLATIALTFVTPLGDLTTRTSSSFTEPESFIDFSYEPLDMDGRLPSARSLVNDANIPHVVAFARPTISDTEVLQAVVRSEEWETIELFETAPGRTVGEVGLYTDSENPDRTFFFATSLSPLTFRLGWFNENYLSIDEIDLSTEPKFAVAVPDREGRFHIVSSDRESGITYTTRFAATGVRR